MGLQFSSHGLTHRIRGFGLILIHLQVTSQAPNQGFTRKVERCAHYLGLILLFKPNIFPTIKIVMEISRHSLLEHLD